MEGFMERSGINTEYAETWHVSEADADRVLWSSTQSDLPMNADIKDISKELTSLKQKVVDLDLHGLFLSDYYRAKKIPRGFRIRTIGRLNPECCKKWTGVLNRCSLNLMVLVIEEVSTELTKARKSLLEFEHEHAALLSAETLQDVILISNTQVDNYKKDLLPFKSEKLRRVNEDYSTHRVYRWLSGERSYYP
ncbi:hypothetical protein XELAEV_18006128mg [Xenopus laevis]|uniref:Uncharacterized protein n=1 Tax=Xenopus laevis TaxID=8355 RepID=A0A974I3X3_XENLA|nr:hypothetical protein XELAEV_18006128mg [Xenopus laevis]